MRSQNTVHPTADIGADVDMGTGNEIGAFCVLRGPLEIGHDNRIGPMAVIGTHGDEIWDRRHDSLQKRIQIGDRCTIREHTTVHKPVYGNLTSINNDSYLMHGAYVAHDTILGPGAVLAQNAAIGGVSRVLERGYIAMGAVLHQQTVCGHFAIVGAGAAAVRSVRPFSRYVPGQPLSVNAYAIDRYGFSDHREEIERYVLDGAMPQTTRLAAMVDEYTVERDRADRGEYS